MASKKPIETNSLEHKVAVLEKLFETGCKTEKELQALSMEKILQIKGITVPDMTVIMELQKHTKKNELYSYLGGGTDGAEHQNE